MKQELVELDPRRFVDSPFQVRKDYDDIDKLAESIKAGGLLQPIVVRLVGTGKNEKHEIVFGHRRQRAAIIAELWSCPCILREMTDDEVAEAILVENLQRQDVPPIYEADGFKRLQDLGYTIAGIEQKLGCSKHLVVSRLQLITLTPKARTALSKNDLNIGAAESLCRIPPHMQDKVLAHLKSYNRLPANRNDVDREIRNNFMLTLKSVPWQLDDEVLVKAAGSCSECPKRTAAQTVLFESDNDDNCLDVVCFKKKMSAFFKKAVKEGPEAHKVAGFVPIKDGKGSLSDSYYYSNSKYKGIAGNSHYINGKNVPVSTIVKDQNVPVYLAMDTENDRCGRVAETTVLNKAVKAYERKHKKPVPVDNYAKKLKEQAKFNKALKVNALTAALEGIDDADASTWVFQWLIDQMSHDTCVELAKFLGLEPGKTSWGGEDWSTPLEKYFTAGGPTPERFARMVWKLMLITKGPNQHREGDLQWNAMLKACGVNLATIKRQTTAQLKPAAKKKAPAKKKAATKRTARGKK